MLLHVLRLWFHDSFVLLKEYVIFKVLLTENSNFSIKKEAPLFHTIVCCSFLNKFFSVYDYQNVFQFFHLVFTVLCARCHQCNFNLFSIFLNSSLIKIEFLAFGSPLLSCSFPRDLQKLVGLNFSPSKIYDSDVLILFSVFVLVYIYLTCILVLLKAWVDLIVLHLFSSLFFPHFKYR